MMVFLYSYIYLGEYPLIFTIKPYMRASKKFTSNALRIRLKSRFENRKNFSKEISQKKKLSMK